jgi:hypothetical protein
LGIAVNTNSSIGPRLIADWFADFSPSMAILPDRLQLWNVHGPLNMSSLFSAGRAFQGPSQYQVGNPAFPVAGAPDGGGSNVVINYNYFGGGGAGGTGPPGPAGADGPAGAPGADGEPGEDGVCTCENPFPDGGLSGTSLFDYELSGGSALGRATSTVGGALAATYPIPL